MGFGTKFLIVTNPLAIPVEVGIFLAIVLKNLFGGVYKDCRKMTEDI